MADDCLVGFKFNEDIDFEQDARVKLASAERFAEVAKPLADDYAGRQAFAEAADIAEMMDVRDSFYFAETFDVDF